LTVEVEAEPAVAQRIFGEHIELARAFARNLAQFGEERGLIGPLEPPRLWSRHILNCGVFADVLPEGGLVGDVGSGAGLPGLVLALARPDVSFALIEPMERRTDWLSEQVAELGLNNVTVVRSRVQDAPYHEKCDVVTARAVSALKTLIPMTAPLVKPGGTLLLMKGASVDREIEEAKKQIRVHNLVNLRVIHSGEGLLEEPTRLVQATVE
jgi:16S rRNA (guanine527-N7)-methyltransferase